MTAPIRPMAEGRAPSGIVGTKVPNISSPKFGPTIKKLTKNIEAIVPISKRKKY